MKRRLLKRGGGIRFLLRAFFLVDLQTATDDAEPLVSITRYSIKDYR